MSERTKTPATPQSNGELHPSPELRERVQQTRDSVAELVGEFDGKAKLLSELQAKAATLVEQIEKLQPSVDPLDYAAAAAFAAKENQARLVQRRVGEIENGELAESERKIWAEVRELPAVLSDALSRSGSELLAKIAAAIRPYVRNDWEGQQLAQQTAAGQQLLTQLPCYWSVSGGVPTAKMQLAVLDEILAGKVPATKKFDPNLPPQADRKEKTE